MRIPDHAGRIHHTYQRHPAHLEDVDLLPVASRYSMAWIRQAGEGDFFIGPVFTESILPIGTDGQDLRTPTRELWIFIP